jgi:sugar phosphate isomerase/epimerase
MPVRLASSPWGFRRTPFARHCRWLADHGVGYVCNQFVSGERGLLDPASSPQELAAAAFTARSHGLRWASVNANGDFMVERGITAQVDLACADIVRAAALRPEVIIVFAGWQPRSGAAVEAQIAGALHEVAACAAGFGLTVALENHGGATATAAQVNRLIEAADAPNLGVNFDAANAQFYGADPLQFLRDLDFPVLFTHCKSVRQAGGTNVYCRIRDGGIDYRPILALLAQRGFAGFHAIEYEDPDDVESGAADDLASLSALLAEVGIPEEIAHA